MTAVKIATMNSRGQLIVPKEYRRVLHMLGENIIQMILERDGIMIRPVEVIPIRRLLAKSSKLRRETSDALKRAKAGEFVEREKVEHIIGEKD